MHSRLVTITTVLVVIILSLVLFSRSMAKPVLDDEHMHCAAGVLLSQGKMVYRDFPYPGQMPYQPLFYAAIFKALKTTHYLLTARILTVFCDILIAVCIMGIYRRIFANNGFSGEIFGLAASVLYVFNPLISRSVGLAWNVDATILCAVLAFWLFISINFEQRSRYKLIALIGGLLTVATCMRITMGLIQLLFFIMILAKPAKSAKMRFKTVLPFLISTLIVLVWPIWTLLAGPHAFFLNQVTMPLHYAALIEQMGIVYGKFELLLISLSIPGGILIALITVFFVIAVVRHRHKSAAINSANFALAMLLALMSLVIVVIPPRVWIESFALPVPFLIICFAFALIYLKKCGSVEGSNKTFRLACLIFAACTVASVATNVPSLLKISKATFEPQSWVPVQAHNVSLNIAEKNKSSRPIATLAAIYALEAGRDIYPELSAGRFTYMIAAAMSPTERRIANVISPRELKKRLKKSLPPVVIVHEKVRSIEKVLIRVAKRGWPKQYYDEKLWERKVYDYGLVVYFKRDEHYRQ